MSTAAGDNSTNELFIVRVQQIENVRTTQRTCSVRLQPKKHTKNFFIARVHYCDNTLLFCVNSSTANCSFSKSSLFFNNKATILKQQQELSL